MRSVVTEIDFAGIGRVPNAQSRPTLRDVLSHDRSRSAIALPRNSVLRARNRRALRGLASGTSLHIGCGMNRLAGWVNVDSNRTSAAELIVDLRGGLPAPTASVKYAFSEHVIEHLDVEVSLRWLRDLAAAMTDGGVLRIATPDLQFVADAYRGNWRDQDWLKDPAYQHVSTAASMFNLAMRGWGHRFLYDFESLEDLLMKSGFRQVRRCDFGDSDIETLRNLETRPDSKLIVEAVR